jgi:hypothetical protein
MLAWLKRKATEKQGANIRGTLEELIALANEADATIQRLGDSFPQQKKEIHRLQNKLRLDLIGPVPLEEVKQTILDPTLRNPGVTAGARIAVDHVYDSAVRSQQGR